MSFSTLCLILRFFLTLVFQRFLNMWMGFFIFVLVLYDVCWVFLSPCALMFFLRFQKLWLSSVHIHFHPLSSILGALLFTFVGQFNIVLNFWKFFSLYLILDIFYHLILKLIIMHRLQVGPMTSSSWYSYLCNLLPLSIGGTCDLFTIITQDFNIHCARVYFSLFLPHFLISECCFSRNKLQESYNC